MFPVKIDTCSEVCALNNVCVRLFLLYCADVPSSDKNTLLFYTKLKTVLTRLFKSKEYDLSVGICLCACQCKLLVSVCVCYECNDESLLRIMRLFPDY